MAYRILKHASFWLAYLLLNVRLQAFEETTNVWTVLKGELLTMPPKILLTYFVFYWTIPRFFNKKNKLLLLLELVVAFAAATLFYRWTIVQIIIPNLHPDLVGKRGFFDSYTLWWTAWDIFITIATATAIKLFRLFTQSRAHEQELQQQKLQSELSFLRAQTNPHFLFNTLNNLYGLARKKSDKTAESIMTLSKIMRFVLYDCRQPFIRLEQEVQVIDDHVSLEKLRYNDRLRVDFQKEIDDGNQQIAPLLLLPFVENAFKHGGKGTTGDAVISIKIQSGGGKLHFEVVNNLEHDTPRESEGIGLKNVRRQLELTYPDRHQLEILPGGDLFQIRLDIDLSEK